MWSRRRQRHRHRNATGCLTGALPAGAYGICTKSNTSTIRSSSLSLVNTETNTTLLTRTLPSNQSSGRVEFNCSCFLYAGTFRFLLRQTSRSPSPDNGTKDQDSSVESTIWWWSSELRVQWPTFHIAVERAGNHSGSFKVGISTNEHFQFCSSSIDSALFLEVSYMEYNQIGRNSIDKVRVRTQHQIKPLRSQTVHLSCAFPFTERDFIRVALRSPHVAHDVKSSGPLYLSRIFSYKLQVENSNAFRSGCEGTMTVKLITPPCALIHGKVLLYKDAGSGRGVSVPSASGAGGTALMGFGPEDPSSPLLAFNWLTQGENETEFNCSVFDPGRNKYCFRFVFNFSRSPSPAQTCLVVHRSADSWGPWQPWSLCSVSCGEGVRERVRECLLPTGVGGMQCTGMVKEQSLCSLEDCAVLPLPSPSLPTVTVGLAPMSGNMVVVAGISLCLAVILATVVVTVWRKFCQTPQCSSARRSSLHSPGGRKLSDEASICGHSLQRPSLSDSHSPLGTMGVVLTQKDTPVLGSQPLTQTLVIPIQQDPERLSPTGQKLLPPIFGYRLAQQQLKEMKKKGLKEATQLYHVSSSPVHDTFVETSASPTASPIPTPTGFINSTPQLGPQGDNTHNNFRMSSPSSDQPLQTSRVTPDRSSPKVELVLGPHVSTHKSGGSSKWRDRTADWVEMVERSGLAGFRGGGATGTGNHKNPNFRRTSSFNDMKPQLPSSVQSRQFRERSMTQVGSRTLPEGSCWTKGGRDRQPFCSYPIPEHEASDCSQSRSLRDDKRKPWMETAVRPHSNELKHTGTNTNSISPYAKHAITDPSSTVERQRVGGMGVREGISGIGGPLSMDRAERAEQNWNRRGPSPIQRNILARKLKEAQSSSGAKGRQRSSTFSVSTPEQRTGRCRSLPMSGDYSNSGSPYRLSEAEQRMLDLDLSPTYVRAED
ncbi:thrombospondin type-1 domain-containing protein 1 isoform X2 [Halichoeres trimaculatus]|uniref:thrombospondin type-1 domain-containing protein 1 isoform X2 n=1 Tax=Halichoeres trimaculatus TaxID=147232 RepID=UPI003D9E40F5